MDLFSDKKKKKKMTSFSETQTHDFQSPGPDGRPLWLNTFALVLSLTRWDSNSGHQWGFNALIDFVPQFFCKGQF